MLRALLAVANDRSSRDEARRRKETHYGGAYTIVDERRVVDDDPRRRHHGRDEGRPRNAAQLRKFSTLGWETRVFAVCGARF